MRLTSALRRSAFPLLTLLLVAIGCHSGGNFGNDPIAATTAHISGRVMGGQQPVSGATINLYAAGTGGDRTAAVLLTTGAPILTLPDGSFTLTGTYNCPAYTSQAYLVATGGNPGLGAVNPQIAVMTALGSCGDLQKNLPFINANEVNTVAAVYALAPFMASATNVAYTSSGTSDEAILDDDFLLSTALSDFQAGSSPGPLMPQGFTLDPTAVNTMANILASCINTSGGTARGTGCGDFFYYATPPGGTAPTNTIDALLDIVNNPTNNVTNLFNLASPTGPFQGTLKNPPTDWNIIPQATLTLAPNAFPVAIGGSTTGTMTLGRPLQAATVSVPLSSAATNYVTVNSPVTIPAGQAVTNFTYNGIAIGESTVSEVLGGYTLSTATLIATNSIVSLGSVSALSPGQTLDLPVSVGQNAPNGGLIVTLASSNTAYATISPTTVTIPAGARVPTANPQVTGVAGGTATITGTAPGYAKGTSSITVNAFTATIPDLTTAVGANSVTLTLSGAAPSSGLTFSLSSSNTSTFTVPSMVVMAGGGTTVVIPITGVADGTATLTASAPGVANSTASIKVDAGIYMQTLQPIGKDLETYQSFGLNQVPRSAVTLTLTSSNPAIVVLSKDGAVAGTASIQYTNQTSDPNIQYSLQGLAQGTSTITASAPGFDTTTRTATVTAAGIIITPATFTTTTLSSATSVDLSTWQLDTNGNPSIEEGFRPGLTPTVSLMNSNPNVGTIPATVMFTPTTYYGSYTYSDATFSFTPVGAGTTNITFTAPAGYSAAASQQTSAATVTAPTISASDQTVGYNAEINPSAFLQSTPPGNKVAQVTITSNNPAVLIAPDGNTVGTTSLTYNNVTPGGYNSIPYVIQGTAVGSATLTFTATGYASSTSTVTVVATGFLPNGTNDQFTTVDGPYTGNGVSLYRLDANRNATGQAVLRAGISSVVTLASSDPTIVTVSPSVTVTAANCCANSTETPTGKAGAAQINLTQPAGYTVPNNSTVVNVTVTAPVIDISGGNVGFNTYTSHRVNLDSAPKNPTTITLTTNNANVLLSTTETAVGSSSISFQNLTTTGGMTFYVQGLMQGSTIITATAASYQTTTQTVQVYNTAFALAPTSFTTTTFSQPSSIGVYASPLDPNTQNVVSNQPLRPGVSATINLTSSNPGVGTVVSTVNIPSGQFVAYANFTPVASGNTTVTVPTQPAGYSVPNNYNASVITVTAPAIDVSGSNFTAVNLENNYAFNLDQAPPSGETVTVTSNNASVLLSTDPSVAGSNSLTFTNVTGTGNLRYYLQGVTASTATLTFSAPGYTAATVPVTVYRSGLTLYLSDYSYNSSPSSFNINANGTQPLSISTVVLDANGNVLVGLPVGPQAGNFTVTVSNSNPAAGMYPATIALPVSSGGAQNTFQALGTGSTTLTLVPPAGFSTAAGLQSLTANVQ